MNRKVLVVSNNSFSKTANNGKTLESIFSGLEINYLSQLYFTDRLSPDFDFCNSYYRILDFDVFRGIFSDHKIVGGIVEKQLFEQLFKSSHKISTILSRFKSNQSFFRFCRDMLWTTNTWRSNTLNDWCLKQNPDFVFFVAGGASFSHNIALYLSRLLKVPLVSFFTDDYLIYPEKHKLFDLIQHNRMKRFYRLTVDNSSLCFAISDLMCETYTMYFGKTFFQIMNSVTIKKYIKKEHNGDKIVINYFGSIHTNRWRMIVKLANILKLSDRNDLILNVYVANKPKKKVLKSFSNVGVNYKGGIFGDDLQKAILQSDILLHVESDDNYSKSITKLSVSTKIPEYLISGRPILGFGPRDVASMKLLIDNKIGVVISSCDEYYVIDNQLEKLLNDSLYRENLAKFAYDYALKHFDNKKVVEDFNMKIDQMFVGKNDIEITNNKMHNYGTI